VDVFALTLRLKEEGAATVKAATDKLGRSFNDASKSATNFDGATKRLTDSMKGLAASLGAALGARALAQAADSYTLITNQLRLATSSTDELATAQARVFAIAQQTAQPLASVADLYARTGRAAGALGLSQAEVARVTAFVNQAIALSGSSAASASGAITQLGQALAAGTLRAEEFNSIQDGAPALISAVEQQLGLQVGQLRQVAMTGQLSSKTFVAAMLANKTVAEEFSTTQRTMGQELTRLENVFVRMVGRLNETYGVTNQVNKAISTLADNLPRVMGALAGVTAGWVAYNVAIRSALVATTLVTSAQTVAAFVKLAKSVRSVADAAALFNAAGGGWLKLAAAIIAVTGSYAAFELVSRKLEAATVSANAALDDLVANAGTDLPAALGAATAAVVDQIAALMQLVTLMPVTRTEAGLLAREERTLQQQLASGNLTYAERLALLQRLLAVQKARESMQVRLTREELMASEMDPSRMIGMTGSGRALPQIRGRGAGVPSTAESLKALEGDAKRVQERLAASIDATKTLLADQLDEMRVAVMIFADTIANTLVDSLAAGIESAITSGSLGQGFKALANTLLSGLGSALIAFGRAAIMASGLMKKFMTAMANMNPFASLAAGIGMVALGGMLKGAAQAAFGGGVQGGAMTMGGGLGSLGVGGMQGGTMRFAATTAGGAGASVTAAQPMQVTIIGPNDAGAQRAIATLMDNAARRGLVQGSALRTL
jgi:tape measure domain-containing protein